jgi:alpha-amylase/alpha-mannosidase (GH57 family)
MWPSEEAVCEHIIPLFIQSGIRWIVTDESILFKSVHAKKRDTRLLYQPHLLRREAGELAVVFRDRNLSDLIGFEYNKWHPKDAVNDFMRHLRNIYLAFGDQDVLVTIALDGENAWEYFRNDGHDFLNEFYGQLSQARFLKTTTVAEYLQRHPPTHEIKRLGAGSWIFGDFGKWMGNQYKNIAWEYLTAARDEFEKILTSERKDKLGEKLPLAIKQMRICEGSDWFWWYGDHHAGFDALFRTHFANFYALIEQPVPEYLKRPIEPQ